jgi:hypothetical protein
VEGFNIFAPWNLCGHCVKLQVEAYAQETNLSDEDFGEVQSKQFFTSLLCRCRKKTKWTIPCWTSTSHRVHFLLGKLYNKCIFQLFPKAMQCIEHFPQFSYNTLRRNDDNMQSNISHIPHISHTYPRKVCVCVEAWNWMKLVEVLSPFGPETFRSAAECWVRTAYRVMFSKFNTKINWINGFFIDFHSLCVKHT